MNVSIRTVCAALAISVMATALLTACGSDSSSDQEGGSTGATLTVTSVPKTIEGQLAKTFPKPEPEAGAPEGTASAIEAGRKACKGKTPIEVRDEFIAAAEAEAGLEEGQKEMLGEIKRFEAQSGHSANFAAGQLAAGVYEATLPENQRVAGFQGCVYELALELRQELAKSKG